MATIKVKHGARTDDSHRLYVEIEIGGKEFAAHGPMPVLEAVGREVGNALMREFQQGKRG